MQQKENDDDILYQHIESLKNGSMESFDIIYSETSHDIYRLIAMIVYHELDREDIMNEVYVQIWQSIDNYDTTKSFKGWVHGIVMNQIKSYRRKKWRSFRTYEKQCNLFEYSDIGVNPDMIAFEQQSDVYQLISLLSYKLKTIIVLRYYADHSLNEISEILKIPLGTVKSRHHLALKELRKKINSKDFEGRFEQTSWILKKN